MNTSSHNYILLDRHKLDPSHFGPSSFRIFRILDHLDLTRPWSARKFVARLTSHSLPYLPAVVSTDIVVVIYDIQLICTWVDHWLW